MIQRAVAIAALLSLLALITPITPAHGGCGCDKAPPLPAAVRPHAAYAGADVSIFHAGLEVGVLYDVTFVSGITGESAVASVYAVSRRDLADGVEKPQLALPIPDLPLGPVSIEVRLNGQPDLILSADDSALTVLPQPIPVDELTQETTIKDYRAAVGRDRVVYISLDLSETQRPRTIEAQARFYALRFTGDDAIFYNIQGFVMQLLDGTIPGLFSVQELGDKKNKSDVLRYSRHEFNTYLLQHAERHPHSVDAEDPNWHLDGTPHIDHDILVLALSGTLNDGSLPVPGATPPFHLVLRTSNIFANGLAGDTSVEMYDHASTAGYKGSASDLAADVLTNGQLTMRGHAEIGGSAIAVHFDLADDAKIHGDMLSNDHPNDFLVVDMPAGLEDLGVLSAAGNDTLVLSTGSYQASEVSLAGRSELFIDNTEGPVNLYVTGPVHLSDFALVTLADVDPEQFNVYVVTDDHIVLSQFGEFYGLVYAPQSLVLIEDHAEFSGALLGNEVVLSDHAELDFDVSLDTGIKEPIDKQLEKETRAARRQYRANEAKKVAADAQEPVEKAQEVAAKARQAADEVVANMTKLASDVSTNLGKPLVEIDKKAAEFADKISAEIAKAEMAAAEASEAAARAASATTAAEADHAAQDAADAAEDAQKAARAAQALAVKLPTELGAFVAKADQNTADAAQQVTKKLMEAAEDLAKFVTEAEKQVAAAQATLDQVIAHAGKSKLPDAFAAIDDAEAALAAAQQWAHDVEAIRAQALSDAAAIGDQLNADAEARAAEAAAAATLANEEAAQAATIAAQAAAEAADAATAASNS